MKKLALLIQLILLSTSIIAQEKTFSLSDTNFESETVLRANIMFDLGACTIDSSSIEFLDSLVFFLQQNKTLEIEVGYHRDSRGSDKMSINITACRAKNIKNYLVDSGIIEQRLTAKGYGEQKLLVSDEEIAKLKTDQEKEEAHARNRRAEFKIMSTTREN